MAMCNHHIRSSEIESTEDLARVLDLLVEDVEDVSIRVDFRIFQTDSVFMSEGNGFYGMSIKSQVDCIK